MRYSRPVLIFSALALCASLSAQIAVAEQGPVTPETDAAEAQVWTPADRSSEQALGLKRADVAEIQGQLTALGLDPRGIDGKMGPGTRNALTEWQESEGIPATGYLDEAQRGQLYAASMIDYAIWLGVPENKALVERAGNPPQASGRTSRKGWYRDSRGRYCRSMLVAIWCQKTRPQGY